MTKPKIVQCQIKKSYRVLANYSDLNLSMTLTSSELEPWTNHPEQGTMVSEHLNFKAKLFRLMDRATKDYVNNLLHDACTYNTNYLFGSNPSSVGVGIHTITESLL